jgi:hypothetical protein
VCSCAHHAAARHQIHITLVVALQGYGKPIILRASSTSLKNYYLNYILGCYYRKISANGTINQLLKEELQVVKCRDLIRTPKILKSILPALPTCASVMAHCIPSSNLSSCGTPSMKMEVMLCNGFSASASWFHPSAHRRASLRVECVRSTTMFGDFHPPLLAHCARDGHHRCSLLSTTFTTGSMETTGVTFA